MAEAPARRWYTSWTAWVPVAALLVLAASWGRDIGLVLVVLVALLLGAAVLAAVHHAEFVAHKIGEPFGSLVLAVAVTIIEVALIVTLMSAGGEKTKTLARDTVFAAVMITLNGIVGLALLAKARSRGLAYFNAEGSGSALAAVAALSSLSLVLPNFTSSPGPTFTAAQLTFAAVVSLALYVLFVLTQTRSHRDFFLPVHPDGSVIDEDEDGHADPPTMAAALRSVGLLLVALVAVVGLAKVESPAIESAVAGLGLPPSFVGVVIALLVLLPETLAAFRAARRTRVQIALNLAYGSAMASIGLTIPAMAILTQVLDTPLYLGLADEQVFLLALSLVVSVLTVVQGRANRLQAGVHLVLFVSFVFLAAKP